MMEENTNKKSPLIIIMIIAVIALVGFIATQGSANNNTQKSELATQTSPIVVEKTELTQATSEAKIVTLEAGAFYYSLKELKVKKGEKVKVVMTSKDMMHDFNIDELKVKSAIAKAGETTTVEFIADTAGEYEYYCSVGQHRVNGQVGKLIVE